MNRLSNNASENIANRLTWHTAARDQAGISKDLADGKDISEVYGLGEAGLFDEFFCFLDTFGIMKLFLKLDPHLRTRLSNVEFPAVILIYLMRVVAGLAFFWHIHPVILRSQPLMRLIGFNGRQVRDGSCRRGLHRNKCDQDPEQSDVDTQEPKDGTIRGPLCPDSISGSIKAIAAHGLQRLFNGTIAIFAAKGFFPKRVHALLDSSEIQSTERCVGCGMVKKEKVPKLRYRKGRLRKVTERVFGFKIWVLWDPTSRLPVALRFATIETPELDGMRQFIEQAIRNLGSQSTLTSVAMDRGFIEGSWLWWLASEKGITFYVPAKKNMHVYLDALALSKDHGIRQSKEKKRNVGYGKNRHTVIDRWEVVGLEGLTSAGFYGPQGSGSHENRKDFIANPINAVVVVHDPYQQNNPDSDTLVILTNAAVKKPLQTYRRYDARSEIENSVFREAKQGWFIERAPRNDIDSFRAHVYITVTTMALTTAFQTWMDQQDRLEKDGKETGIRKFREKVKQENGNKLIIFDEDRYAIFDTYEVFILCGRTVLKPTGVEQSISKEDILHKYGALLE